MILGRRWWFELDFAYSLFTSVRYVSNLLKCALKVQYSRAEILATYYNCPLIGMILGNSAILCMYVHAGGY